MQNWLNEVAGVTFTVSTWEEVVEILKKYHVTEIDELIPDVNIPYIHVQGTSISQPEFQCDWIILKIPS